MNLTLQSLIKDPILLGGIYLVLILINSIWLCRKKPVDRFLAYIFLIVGFTLLAGYIIKQRPFGIILEYAFGLGFGISTLLWFFLVRIFRGIYFRTYKRKIEIGKQEGNPVMKFRKLNKLVKEIEESSKNKMPDKRQKLKLNRELRESCEKGGDLKIIAELIGKGADVNSSDSDGLTPVMHLTEYITENASKLLLLKAAGADFNAREEEGRTALSYFVDRSSFSEAKRKAVIVLLVYTDINSQDKEGKTALMHAASKYKGMGKLLLRAGADPKIKDKFGKTAMHYAVEEENKSMVKNLEKIGISKPSAESEKKRKSNLGAKAQKQLDEDLLWGASSSDIEELKDLINEGANVNAADEEGNNPLMEAASHNSFEGMELFLEEGADVHKKNGYNQTALHLAAYSGNKECCKLLLEMGSIIDEQDSEGKTPLILAAENDYPETVKFLLSKNADKRIKDKEGKTAKDYAVEYEYKKVEKML